MSRTDIHGKRPISPHISIYKLIPTMLMSILHRITGVALYFGTILIVWWLFAASSGQEYYDLVNGVLTSFPFLVIFFGYTWALFHHMLGGIRHFIWDTGRGFDKHLSTKMAWATLIGSLTLTALFWLGAFIAWLA